jgi:phosphinothricin acetyltransferase
VLVYEDEQRHGGPRVAGARVIGWASLNRYNPREAYGHTVELSVYVRDGYRGRGIGRALVRELLDQARSVGHHVVLAQVAADQEPSLAMHRSLGFREVGTLREVGFKFDRWLDVVLMDRLLAEPIRAAGAQRRCLP